jgi:large subunit ribosomal protein L24e
MARCTFCGNELERGTGIMLVKKDGSIHYFCSSKCENNLLHLSRVPRVVKWTKNYREFKKSESSINKEAVKKETKKSAAKKE